MLGFGETEVAKEKFYAAKIPILQRKCNLLLSFLLILYLYTKTSITCKHIQTIVLIKL